MNHNNQAVQALKPNIIKVIEEKLLATGLSKETVVKELSFAQQIYTNNPYFSKCSVPSLMAAIVNVGNIGLTLNPASKECYLIPRYNKTKKEMQIMLEPSYIGLVKLITDTGSVKSVVTNVVYENDQFDYDAADNIKPVTHKPCLFANKRGELIGCYSVATFGDNTRQAEWMDIESIHKIRETSESWKKQGGNSIWGKHETEMFRKTIIRRLYKYLPRTGNQLNADQAIYLSNENHKDDETPIQDIAKKFIANCDTEQELTTLYKERKEWHGNNEILQLFKERKSEIIREQEPVI